MLDSCSARGSRVLAAAVVAALGATGVGAPTLARADSAAESTSLGEVVVTSRRVEERLQDTPIAVSAFQTEDIEKLNIRNVADAAAFTPNFISNPGPTGGNDGFYFIRGVGQTDLNPATDPGVATYIDGVYLGRVQGSSPDSGDIARIEVLRGPQGTLFGRNTIGGAISLTTRDPGDEFAARVFAGVGSRDLVNARVSFDVPFGENNGLLLSAGYRDQDGWGRRADGAVFDSTTSKTARAKYVLDASETFSLELSADYTKLTGTSQHTVLVAFNPRPGPTGLSPLAVPLPDLSPFVNTTRPYVNQSNTNPDKDYDVKGAALTLDWDLGFGSLKSITAYRALDQFITLDYDSTPFAFYQGAFVTDQKQWSQELQLSGETGRVQWLAGAFYYDETVDHVNVVSLGGNNGCLPFPVPTSGYPVCSFQTGQAYATPGANRVITNNQAFTLDVQSVAVFGQATIGFTERLSATLGLRWTDETKDQAYDFFIDNSARVANAAGLPPVLFPTFSPRNPANRAPTAYSKTWSELTPKAGLEFKATDDVLTYVSYARGFKSGGFNGRPNPNSQGVFGTVPSFEPEVMDTYEVGLKSQFADDRVRLNVAGYWSEYDTQFLRIGNSGFFETLNAAARIKGFETELLARPVPALQLQLALGYADSGYRDITANLRGLGIDESDRLPLTPKWNGSVGAEYTWDAVANGAVSLRADYSFRSELWYEATNTAVNRQGGYGLLNARATYEFADGVWSVAAYGLNVTDKAYYTNVQDVAAALGVSFASVGAPREWGLEFRYRFGN